VSSICGTLRGYHGVPWTLTNKHQAKCLKAMDAVNRKFGKGAIRLTSEGVDQSTWTASSDYKSNAFTTNWSELMVVK